MASAPDAHRCVPCEDGRKLLIAAAVARIAWGLACGRLAPGEDGAPLAAWAALAVSSIAPVPAYRLAINLRLERRAALIAGGLVAIHPALVDAASRASLEAAWPTLTSALLVAWVYAWQSGSDKAASLAGLFAGALAWVGAPAAAAAAALAWPLVAFVRRAEQPRWKSAVAAFLLVGGLVAAPSVIHRPTPSVATEWSAPVAVTPAAGPNSRAVRRLFFASLCLFSVLGLGLRRCPGAVFVLLWLALVAVSHAWTGAGPRFSEDPALAVLAASGFQRL